MTAQQTALRPDILQYGARFDTNATPPKSKLSPHLKALEAESIYIMREVAAEFRNPVLLYSIGKDSSVMIHLAMKAFWPSKPPFPLMHIAAGWDFNDMIVHRDQLTKALNLKLIIQSNKEAFARGLTPFNTDSREWARIMLIEALKAGLDGNRFDAAFGGARRDEEKAGPRNGFSRFARPGIAGTRAANGPNCGTFTTRVSPGEKQSGFFRFQTGPNLISGNISDWKTFRSCLCILPEKDQWWNVTVY